jgi:hypothetical protein
VNEAVHAFVGVTGDEHLDDTEVDVHASTGERARVTIRGSAREALASLPASTRPGPAPMQSARSPPPIVPSAACARIDATCPKEALGWQSKRAERSS